MGKISDKEFVDILGSDALLGQKDGCYKNVRTESLIDLIRDIFNSSVNSFYNGVASKNDIPQTDKGWWFASEKGEYVNFANVTIGENNLPVVTPIVNNADLSIISIDKDGRYQIKTIVQSFVDSYNALTQQYILQYTNALAQSQQQFNDQLSQSQLQFNSKVNEFTEAFNVFQNSTYESDGSIYISKVDNNYFFRNNVSSFEQSFDALNSVTLLYTPSNILGVYVDGVKQPNAKYNIVLPKTINLVDDMTGKNISIVYEHIITE